MFSPALALLMSTTPAASPAQAKMIEEARIYFEEEKRGTAGFMFVGASALLGSGFLAFSNDDTMQGAAIPIAIVGLGEMLIGGIVFFRTERQLAALEAQIAKNSKKYVEEELPRIEAVNSWFGIYKIVELSLAAIGGVLAAYGSVEDEPTIEGIGYGLAIQAAIAMIGDTFAESRAHRYEAAIRTFSLALGQTKDTTGQNVETVGVAVVF